MKIAVGSLNKSKITSVKLAAEKVFSERKDVEVVGVSVVSGVSAQPKSGEETMKGAICRAQSVLDAGTDCTYAVGLEGGIEKVGDIWFECGWIAIIEKSTKRIGLGTSARYQIADHIVDLLFKGHELATITDALTQKHNVRESTGMMGEITNGALPRDICYMHGVIFAFSRFVSDEMWWSQTANEKTVWDKLSSTAAQSPLPAAFPSSSSSS